MKQTIATLAVLGIAASVMANGYEEFGGIVKVYDVTISGESIQVKSGKDNLQINDQKINADLYAKGSGTLKGVLVDYNHGSS